MLGFISYIASYFSTTINFFVFKSPCCYPNLSTHLSLETPKNLSKTDKIFTKMCDKKIYSGLHHLDALLSISGFKSKVNCPPMVDTISLLSSLKERIRPDLQRSYCLEYFNFQASS